MVEGRRKKYEILRTQLENERSSFLPHWRQLGDFILPRRPRFFTSDVNKGDRRNQKIVDSTATLSARTLRSGLMSGITSPAREWKKLTTPDPDMAEFGSVKEWLDVVNRRMSSIFLRSNLYNILPTSYGDLGVFGTSPISIEEDFDDVVRFQSFPVGSYMIAKDDRGQVNTFHRDFRMTVRQLVMKFGVKDERTGKAKFDNFSKHIKNLWDRGSYQTWIDIRHTITPNDEHDPDRLEAKYKKFGSCYYEAGSSSAGSNYFNGSEDDLFLKESGFDLFPILCPRWEVTGEDVYGTSCPGMEALGDIKALQKMQARKAEAIEKMVRPPMIAPTALRREKATVLPGDVTFYDEREGQRGFRPAYEVNPRVNELVMDIQEYQHRIQRCFYEDLFLMLANSDRRQITAREIDERHEEKLLALGPVLEQLNQDLLDPLITNTFEFMNRQGYLPPPPKELQGVKLKIEYVSVLAQAQKLAGISGIERFTGFVGQIGQVHPDALDKINSDELIDVYGDRMGIEAKIIRTDDEVAQIRQQRQQAQQAQAQAEMIKQGAGAAKDLSQANMDQDSALTRLLQQANAGSLVSNG